MFHSSIPFFWWLIWSSIRDLSLDQMAYSSSSSFCSLIDLSSSDLTWSNHIISDMPTLWLYRVTNSPCYPVPLCYLHLHCLLFYTSKAVTTPFLPSSFFIFICIFSPFFSSSVSLLYSSTSSFIPVRDESQMDSGKSRNTVCAQMTCRGFSTAVLTSLQYERDEFTKYVLYFIFRLRNLLFPCTRTRDQ